MPAYDLIRGFGPMLLAVAAAVVIDLLTRRRGLDPPGFQVPAGAGAEAYTVARVRRSLALLLVAMVLYVGVFSPLSMLGAAQEVDFSTVESPQLFLLHGILVLSLCLWYFLGYVGVGESRGGETTWPSQFGWRTSTPGREIGIGLAAGVVAWFVVSVTLLLLSALLVALGGEDAVLQEPPEMVVWIAALPVGVRLAVSLSAGVVEETFFRGFLQPRIGIGLSTLLFTVAHLSYEQPLMLVGIALLSLVFAHLVRWRQNLWAAMTAHALFDALQLLVVVPTVLRFVDGGARGSVFLLHLVGGTM